VTNTATVTGGGELNNGNNSGQDTVTVIQVPASVQVQAGNNQSATVGTAFTNVLQAVVRDAANVVIPNQSVTFTAPGSGASGTFANNTNTTTHSTNGSGIASATTFTANNTPGQYLVSATAGAASVNFTLTNLAGAASTIAKTQGDNQSANINTQFAQNLQVRLTDSSNNPVSGVNVTFAAPGSGASGTFAASATVPTNAQGFATAPAFTANSTGGQYAVTATAGALSTSFTLTNTVPAVNITVTTAPPGLTIVVDGNPLTSPQTFNWTPGSNHSIGTVSLQSGTPGTQFRFSNWSDGGDITHTIITPAGDTTFTANFGAEYQLTLAASPANGGTVTPASGQFFASGTVVNVSATAQSGFAFANWSGPVANPTAAATTVTMSGPASLTAVFNSAGGTTMNATIAGKSGPSSARVWTLNFINNGPGAATGISLNGFTLTQVAGTACTPVLMAPVSFPAAVGSATAGNSAQINVTINFTGCAAAARFRLTAPFSANGGTVSGTLLLNNQFQ
jgi:hypothetical protein